MQHLSWRSLRHSNLSVRFARCQGQVRCFALHRIKPHAPPLVRAPVNSFEFQPCGRTPQAEHLVRWRRHGKVALPTSSVHRLPRGLPGYLILFAPHAFVPQCQCPARPLPSPWVFFPISTHFTATPGVPRSSLALEPFSLHCRSQVEPRAFTADLNRHLRTLYAQ